MSGSKVRQVVDKRRRWADRAKKEQFDYDDYVREREVLSKWENDCYDGYQRAILTLSSAFLAVSVSLIALLREQAIVSAPTGALSGHGFLIGAWSLFGISVGVTLLTYPANAMGFRREVRLLEDALEDAKALTGGNAWPAVGYVLYAMAGVTFGAGVVLLLYFSRLNIIRL